MVHLKVAGRCKREKGKSVSKLKFQFKSLKHLEKLEYVTLLQKRQAYVTLLQKRQAGGSPLRLIGWATNEQISRGPMQPTTLVAGF